MDRRDFLRIFAGAAAAVVAERVVKPVYFDFGRFHKPPRKLKAIWTMEAEQDLEAYHGLMMDYEYKVSSNATGSLEELNAGELEWKHSLVDLPEVNVRIERDGAWSFVSIA